MPTKRVPPVTPQAKRGRRNSRLPLVILAVVLLAGALLRVSYLREIVSAPDFAAPLADAAFHDYWARALLTGDWTPPDGEPDPRIREVPYLRPPGYTFFLAGLYALTGESYLGARILQMALGLGNVVLAFLLARAVFSPAVGLVLAGFCATYWSLVYFEGELHAPVLVTALNLATLLGLLAWARRPGLKRGFAAGLFVGLGALVQTNALLFAPVGALWIALGGRRLAPPATALRSGLAYLAGTLVAVAPATLRNAVVAKEFVPVASNGAITLLLGNHEAADGVSSRLPALPEFGARAAWSWFAYDEIVRGLPGRGDRPLRYANASRLFVDRTLEFIRRQPGKFLSLTVRRALLFWGPDEVSNNKAIRVEKARSGTLRLLPGFPSVLSISLVGAGALVAGARRRPPARRKGKAAEARAPATAAATAQGLPDIPRFVLVACGLYILATFVSFLPFLAAARFRAPLVPLIFLFGAFGLVQLAGALRRGAWGRATAAVAVWVVVLLACRHSFHGSAEAEAWWHTDRAVALLRSGQTAAAVQELEEALRANPGYVDAHVTLGDVLGQTGRGTEAVAHYREVLQHRPNRADVRFKLGSLLVEMRRFDEAVVELEEVLRATPISAEAHFGIGRARIEQGRVDEGIEALRLSLQFDPAQAAAHVNIGIALASRGDHAGALAEYAKALEIDPADADAELRRGESLQALGREDEAAAALARSFEHRKSAAAAVRIGNLHMRGGRNEEAARWFRQAVELEPRDAMARTSLAGALANLRQYEEAVKHLESAVATDPSYAPAQERLRVLREWLQSSGQGTGG